MTWFFNPCSRCCNRFYCPIAVIDESTPYGELDEEGNCPQYQTDLALWNTFIDDAVEVGFPVRGGVIIPKDRSFELTYEQDVEFAIKSNPHDFPENVSFFIAGQGTNEERITVADIYSMFSIIRQDENLSIQLDVLGTRFWLDTSGSLELDQTLPAVEEYRELECAAERDFYYGSFTAESNERWLRGLAQIGRSVMEVWEAGEAEPNCDGLEEE